MKRLVTKMLVGFISDTHDCLPMVEKAVEKLNEANVELVLHAGDYVAPFVIPKLGKLKSKMIGVFGNNDGDHEFLKKQFSEHENLEIHGDFAQLTVDGMKIALIHGAEVELLNALIDGECFDVVVRGHLHKAEVFRKGKTLVVNPGEVCGYLSGKSTIALFDTVKRETKIIDI